jgi:hypothetical protein
MVHIHSCDNSTGLFTQTVDSLSRLRGRGGEGVSLLESLCVPPPYPSPSKRAFTPVNDGRCGGGDASRKALVQFREGRAPR